MEKELEKKNEGALAKPMAPGRGFEEGANREDLIIPRAALMQPTSPQVLREGTEFKLGQIINSVTEEMLPGEFVPIFKFTRWIRFNPRKKDDPNFDPAFDAGAELWRSDDPEDERVKTEGVFGPNGEKPLATKFMNFFCYFTGCKMPIIVSFCNTSFGAGKKLLTLAWIASMPEKEGDPRKDMFEMKYKLSSKVVSNDLGTFAVFEVTPAGVADEPSFRVAEAWYTQFKEKKIEVHHDEPGSEG